MSSEKTFIHEFTRRKTKTHEYISIMPFRMERFVECGGMSPLRKSADASAHSKVTKPIGKRTFV